jgi:hypothetical protein
MDVAYLRLLSDVADRSPRGLWSVVYDRDSLSSLFRACATSFTNVSSSSNLEILEAYLGALCHVGISYEKAREEERVIVGTDVENARHRGTFGDDAARDEAEAKARHLLAGSEIDDRHHRHGGRNVDVDRASPPARLGMEFLPRVLESIIVHASHATTSSSSCRNRADYLLRCASHLSSCAERCPSILAGDDIALSSTMRTCMALARHVPKIDEYDVDEVSSLRLMALDVLATMCSVPDIKRSLTKATSSPSPRCVGEEDERRRMMKQAGEGGSSLLRFLIRGDGDDDDGRVDGGVLHLCAEMAVVGIDDDEGAWSDECAVVTNDGGADPSWEDDRVALHAESLLESFVENLGGAYTLPSIFVLVDRLLQPSTASDPSSWRNRRAALSILERCLAAAPVTFAPHVPAAVEAALRSIGDSSPRVQYQALQFLGSLCCADSLSADAAVDNRGGRRHRIPVRENYGEMILEAVSLCITSRCTKVAAQACGTIVSYCRGGNGSEDCMVPISKGLIAPYVGILLDALRSGPLSVDLTYPDSVDGGRLTVLVRAIGAVACLADSVGEDFLPHYAIMGGLKACALFGLSGSGGMIKLAANVKKNTHEMAILRGSAIEAASIVGQAISGPDGSTPCCLRSHRRCHGSALCSVHAVDPPSHFKRGYRKARGFHHRR